jgi:hypothetical protein
MDHKMRISQNFAYGSNPYDVELEAVASFYDRTELGIRE